MEAPRILRRFACAAALAVSAAGAHAVDWGMSDSTMDALRFDATQSMLTRRLLDGAAARSRSSTPGNAPSTAAPLAANGAGVSVASRLAASVPPAQRGEVERAL